MLFSNRENKYNNLLEKEYKHNLVVLRDINHKNIKMLGNLIENKIDYFDI